MKCENQYLRSITFFLPSSVTPHPSLHSLLIMWCDQQFFGVVLVYDAASFFCDYRAPLSYYKLERSTSPPGRKVFYNKEPFLHNRKIILVEAVAVMIEIPTLIEHFSPFSVPHSPSSDHDSQSSAPRSFLACACRGFEPNSFPGTMRINRWWQSFT